MKYLLLASLVSIVFSSCSKNDLPASPPVLKDSSCVVTSLLVEDGLYPKPLYNFSYNADGKLTQVTFNSTTAYTYTYSGSKIFIDMPPYAVDTTQLNSHGFVTQWSNFVNKPDLIDTSIGTYIYTDDTVSTSGHYQETAVPSTNDFTYTFSNGDLSKITFTDGSSDTYTYYEDKPLTGGEVNDIIQLLNYGAPIYKNKHLIKSATDGVSTLNYTYTQDAGGKVLTETVSGSGSIAIYTFGYACHL